MRLTHAGGETTEASFPNSCQGSLELPILGPALASSLRQGTCSERHDSCAGRQFAASQGSQVAGRPILSFVPGQGRRGINSRGFLSPNLSPARA
jgi:hypothetical protein